jgi:hypothetical protein
MGVKLESHSTDVKAYCRVRILVIPVRSQRGDSVGADPRVCPSGGARAGAPLPAVITCLNANQYQDSIMRPCIYERNPTRSQTLKLSMPPGKACSHKCTLFPLDTRTCKIQFHAV